MSFNLNRREVLKTSVALAAGAAPLANTEKAQAAESKKLRTAHVGVGGMGGADLSSIASHSQVEVTALCDVDQERLNKAAKKFPKAKTYRDYRLMISELADSIDAVVVSTPDHTHAPAAMTALNHNKPVYCQKPLTHEVFEARQLRVVAEQKKLTTQMGIQASAMLPYRAATQMVQAGVVGKVSRVYAWSHKNWGYDGPAFEGQDEAPSSFDWNLWLGTAEERPFKAKVYHPGQWRKLVDFGTGTLGDMGVHIFDTPYRALALTAPKWAKTTCRQPTNVGHPEQNIVEYEFPGTQYTTDSLIWKWYDGAFAPPEKESFGLPADLKLPNQGALFIGEKGTMLLPHVSNPQIFVDGKQVKHELPKITIKSHYHQWVDACLGKDETSSSFSYGGPLTEALLLGVVANRFPETTLEWDAEKMEVTNLPEANKLIRRKYRDGFEVNGL